MAVRRRTVPLATGALLGMTLVAFAFELAGGGMPVCQQFGLVPSRLLATGDVVPLVTYAFLHDPHGLLHVGGNLLVLSIVGPVVERTLGGLRFLMLYVCAAVLAGLLHVIAMPSAAFPLVGSSGSLCALLAVAVVMRPALVGVAIGFIGWNIAALLTGTAGDVSAPCHLGGFCAGVLFAAVARGSVHPPRRELALRT
jgi:membrane associated rhomboid family serine protease